MDKLKFNIPEKVLRYLVVCIGIIVFLMLFGIIPLSRYNAAINNDIEKLQLQIKEQKSLRSMYALLNKRTEKKDLQILPGPAKNTLPRREANRFQDVFREIAEKSGLKTVSISPDLMTMTDASNFILYTAVIRGEFVDFRKMLLGMGYVSYIEKIEEISIQQFSGALEFKMKILIALGK